MNPPKTPKLLIEHLTAQHRRLTLRAITADFVAVLEDNNYTFSKIVEGFSNYALREIGKIPCEKPSWEIVSVVLKFSANKIMIILNRPSVRERCRYLQKSVTEFVETLQSEQYTFSEILLALASYVEGKECIDTSKKSAWWEIVALLKLAALQGQVEGRELP